MLLLKRIIKYVRTSGKDEEDRKTETKPYAQLSYAQLRRPPCPFYGFNMSDNIMRDSRGRQCALITGYYGRCQMEMVRDKPSWHNCSLNTQENRNKITRNLDKIRVFPREFRPANAKEWDGMSLMSWVKYIIDGVPIKE